MVSYRFTAYGHPNIRATHKNTFEFTKDPEVTPRGDCILGVNAEFSLPKFSAENVRITMTAGGITECVNARINKLFTDEKELVVRKSDFLSPRTFGINADKACIDLSTAFREKLNRPGIVIEVMIDET